MRLAGEGCLNWDARAYVVMEIRVRHSDPVGGVSDVNQAVVVVLVLVEVAAELEVIEPDVGGLLDGDAITAHNPGELQVADDDVLGILDREIDAGDS